MKRALVLGLALFSLEAAAVKKRDFLLTLPILIVNKESMLGAELKVWRDFSLGLNWSQRYESKSTDPDRAIDPLQLRGGEVGLIISRFSNGRKLSGMHWGAGIGYQTLKGTWDLPRKKETLKLDGVTGSARVGYRFVAESIGFVAGLYLKVRHFNGIPSEVVLSPEELHDLRKNTMTSWQPGLELGWAF